MRQFRTKAYLKAVAKSVKEAEHRAMLARIELDFRRRFWRQEVNEYWKERAKRARRKAKA